MSYSSLRLTHSPSQLAVGRSLLAESERVIGSEATSLLATSRLSLTHSLTARRRERDLITAEIDSLDSPELLEEHRTQQLLTLRRHRLAIHFTLLAAKHHRLHFGA